MAETVTRRERKVATPPTPIAVSAVALAKHLDCSRAYIQKLEAEGILVREGDTYPLDQNRTNYIRFLRRERKASPRSEAEAWYQRQKAELIAMRVAKMRRELMPVTQYMDEIDSFGGLVLQEFGKIPPAIAGRDLTLRKRAEDVVRDARIRLSMECDRRAKEWKRKDNGGGAGEE